MAVGNIDQFSCSKLWCKRGVRILDNPNEVLAVVLNMNTGVITRRNEDNAALILQCKPCSPTPVQILDEIVESGTIRLLLRLEV